MQLNTPVVAASIPPGCTNILCFDVTQSATAFSAVAGVLAGFAFLAIILLLESRVRGRGEETRQARRGLENVLITFVTAFLSAVIASFLFAQVSREQVVSTRALTLGFVSSVTLSVAVLDLIYGVVWMLKTWGLREATLVTSSISALLAPGLVFLYIGISGLDIISERESDLATDTWLSYLMLALLAVLVGLFFVVKMTEALSPVTRRLASDRAVRITAYASLGIAALSAAGIGIIGEFGTDFSLSRLGVALAVFVIFFALCLYILLVQAVQHRLDEEP